MSKKDNLIDKLCRKPLPKNFTTQELDLLMSKCDCEKRQGGRGYTYIYSSISLLDEFLHLMVLIQETNYTVIKSKR